MVGAVSFLLNVLVVLWAIAFPSPTKRLAVLAIAFFHGPMVSHALEFNPLFQKGWDILPTLVWGSVANLAFALLLSFVYAIRGQRAPASQARWSWTSWSALRGLGAGALVGTFAYPLIDLRLCVIWGFFMACVVWLWGGWNTDPADISTAAAPGGLLSQDRRTFWSLIRTGSLLGGAVCGVAYGILFNFLSVGRGGGFFFDTVFGVGIGCAIGMGDGLCIGLVTAFHRTAYGEFTLARHWLAHTQGLPRDLMPFLADAHETHGILRRVGPYYQFRHTDLQRHLASRPAP